MQAVVNWSIVPAQSIVAKNMRQLGLNVPLFQSHGFGNRKYVEQAGVAAEGTFSPPAGCSWWTNCRTAIRRKPLLAAYKKDYEAPLQGGRQHLWRTCLRRVLVVVEALKKAGSTGPGQGARRHRESQGPGGHGRHLQLLAHRPHRAGLDAFEMLTVKDGKFAIYKT